MPVKLINNTPKVQRDLRIRLAHGINNACQYWVTEAQDLAPVRTGFLRDNIKQTIVATPNNLVGEVKSLAPYSGYVNYGTSRMAAQPFFTVATLLTRQKFASLFKSVARFTRSVR